MSASSWRKTSRASGLGWLCLGLAACGATHLIDHDAASDDGAPSSVTAGSGGTVAPPSGGGSPSARGGSPTAGGAPSSGAPSSGGALGGANDAPSFGGEATTPGGAAGMTSSSGGEPATADECASDDDCAAMATRPATCVWFRCQAGQCATLAQPKGTPVSPNTPPDCHASVCDGRGDTEQVIDLKNHPVSTNACEADSCDAQGNVLTKPSPAGTACSSASGGKLCDGVGACVECLSGADCAGDTCLQGRCVGQACSNGSLDGTETDVDCGGVCPPCAEAQKCKIDQDCVSDDCEQLRLTCLPTSCLDGVKDGSETDVDCGGADCSPCYLSKACLVNADCATNQCDSVKLTCRGSACRDQRTDGTETDVDCGGWECGPCHVGQACLSNFDCQGGHLCSTSAPHVCYGL